METSYFSRLAQINVSAHIEKKNGFSYLSWPYAVAELRQADPTALWGVQRFNGLPYLKTETGYFVETSVTVQGLTLAQIHPVLDGKNHPIFEPTCFDINTAIARCLTKNIALHGLGLYLYAGDDLPQGETPAEKPIAPVTKLTTASPATAPQLRYIRGLVEETGSELQKVLDYFGVNTLEELTSQAASRAIKSREKNRSAA